MQNQTEPMDASQQFCPNETCSARGQIGEGNIRIHSYHPQRYRCRTCKKTFSARRGTMMEGLRTPAELVMRVIILLAYGCPTQAIVHAYGLDERTVAEWQKRAGKVILKLSSPVVCLCTGGKYFNNEARRLNEISSTPISRIAINRHI